MVKLGFNFGFNLHPTRRLAHAIVIKDERSFNAPTPLSFWYREMGVRADGAVGISKDIFIESGIVANKVVQHKMIDLGKHGAALEQRRNDAFMMLHQPDIHLLIPHRAAKFHAVFFRKALKLPMPKHGQTGQSGQHDANAKIFFATSKLLYRRFFVGVIHKADITLKNLRVEGHRVFDHGAISGVLFVAQHVHKRAVINAVHAQGAHKIAFHHPKRLSQKQGVGGFDGAAVNHIAPKFVWHQRVKFGFAHGMVLARWN